MTGEDFRQLALGMQGTVEKAHMGHPDFRVNGRIFATLPADERSGVVKVTPEEQQELVATQPEVFVPVAGAWGREGWTRVRLESADEASVRGAIVLAWERATERPRRRSSRG